jgi:hypothetical protein
MNTAPRIFVYYKSSVRIPMNRTFVIIILLSAFALQHLAAQGTEPYTGTFIARMGSDTVSVETYTIINNHLYGKAFIRVPEDYIGHFSIHFYPDGTIREFNVEAMDPANSSIPFKAVSRDFEYRLNMNCVNDTCYYYNSHPQKKGDVVFRHAADRMDFVGGWVPLISLMEWITMRLHTSGKTFLPLKMINHNIGVYNIGIERKADTAMVFGGPFLEYTRIEVDAHGRIQGVDGLGTPWNYTVSKHAPLNIDKLAERMTRTSGIGVPSPTETVTERIDGADIHITYGRPLRRGRQIFGGVVPFDSLWRTGANASTRLEVSRAIRIGTTRIPKGTYSLYTIPGKKEWLLLVSKDISSWPTDPDRSLEIARAGMRVKQLVSPVEQFTISIVPNKRGGTLKFAWADTEASADFSVLPQ